MQNSLQKSNFTKRFTVYKSLNFFSEKKIWERKKNIKTKLSSHYRRIHKLRKEEGLYKNWEKINHILRKKRSKFYGHIYRMENKTNIY